MYKTAAGKALWDKYGNSKTHDIYITTGKMDPENKVATLSKINRKMGSLIMDKKERKLKDGKLKEETTFANLPSEFEQLNGKTIKNLERDISMISIGDEYLTDHFEGANSLYHEIAAHIDGDVGNQEEDHEAFGLINVYDDNGEFDHYEIRSESKAHNFLKQLLIAAEAAKKAESI